VFNTEEVLSQLVEVLTPSSYKDNDKVKKNLVARAIAGEIKTIDHLRFSIIDYLVSVETGVVPTPLFTKKEEEKDDEDKEVVEKIESVGKSSESAFVEAMKKAFSSSLAAPSAN